MQLRGKAGWYCSISAEPADTRPVNEPIYAELTIDSTDCGITENGKTITKIKGFKNSNNLDFNEIKNLLTKNSQLKLNHVKWFRNVNKITMKESPYLLTNTENKRTTIYENNIAVNTKAFTLINNQKIE